jgi:hypothetical protein
MCLIAYRQGHETVSRVSDLRAIEPNQDAPNVIQGSFIESTFHGIDDPVEIENAPMTNHLLLDQGLVLECSQSNLRKIRAFLDINERMKEEIKIFSNDYLLLLGKPHDIRTLFIKIQTIIHD